MKNYLVYMHRCLINRKVYIGITNNRERRWRFKGIEYKPPKKDNQNGRSFWNAIQKYGWDNFEHIILQENLSFEEAIDLEIEYIKKYDSTNKKCGYNISKGGNGGKIYEEHPKGMLGKKQTKYQIETQREWASKNENNCMTNGQVVWGKTHNHPRGMKGKTHSEEYKEMLKSRTGEKSTFRREVKCTMPNGEILNFPTVRSCAEHLGLNSTSKVLIKCLKTGEPYKIKGNIANRKFFETLEGLVLEYI